MGRPTTEEKIAAAGKALQALGLKVTRLTIHRDGTFNFYTVEERDESGTFTLTSAPKLRDAREKFRAG
jgi:hypothetical protein